MADGLVRGDAGEFRAEYDVHLTSGGLARVLEDLKQGCGFMLDLVQQVQPTSGLQAAGLALLDAPLDDSPVLHRSHDSVEMKPRDSALDPRAIGIDEILLLDARGSD